MKHSLVRKSGTNKKVITIALVLVVALGLNSCAKWFDKNLGDSKVALLSPPNNHSDSLLTKTFWWDEAEGVREYQLQVVSPTFDSIVNFVLDTTVGALSFEKTLTAGSYQWRVRPVNDSYQGVWTTYSFVIINTDNLAGQTITGTIPSGGHETNNLTVDFSWTALSKASNYIFTIKDKNGTTVFVDVITTTNASYTFTADGAYTWSVQAQNDISASLSSSASLIIDNSAPLLPNLLTIVGDTIKSFPATFTWSDVVDGGSSITDTLLFSTQSDFSTVETYKIVTDKTSLELDTLLNTGTYFWKLGRADAVGNYGGRTPSKSFEVQ